jgi:hypothetical protein
MWRHGGHAMHARFALFVAFCTVTQVSVAFAGEPDATNLSRARDAYARGAAAFSAGDYGRAADDLASADALYPDDVTLKAALDAVTRADDAVLGAQLIERANRVRDPSVVPGLEHSLALATARFAHRTGRIVVRHRECPAVVDGRPISEGVPTVVLVGVHVVAVQCGAVPEEYLVKVSADETHEVVPGEVRVLRDPTTSIRALPVPPLRPHEAREHGISPVWFVATAVLTLGLGVATLVSGIETVNDHGQFDSAGCGMSNGRACASLASSGRSVQTTTTGLGIGTGVAAVGTTALGLFGVRRHRQQESQVSIDLAGGALYGRFTF